MSRDFEMNQRQPKVFQLYYRSGKFKNSADHSRSAPMPRSVLQVLTSPAYSDTDGDAELSADAGGEAEVEVQGDLSELRDDPTADNVLDVGAQGGVSERTRALAKVLEDTSFRVVESIDDLFPCTRIAIAASGFQELPSQVCRTTCCSSSFLRTATTCFMICCICTWETLVGCSMNVNVFTWFMIEHWPQTWSRVYISSFLVDLNIVLRLSRGQSLYIIFSRAAQGAQPRTNKMNPWHGKVRTSLHPKSLQKSPKVF